MDSPWIYLVNPLVAIQNCQWYSDIYGWYRIVHGSIWHTWAIFAHVHSSVLPGTRGMFCSDCACVIWFFSNVRSNFKGMFEFANIRSSFQKYVRFFLNACSNSQTYVRNVHSNFKCMFDFANVHSSLQTYVWVFLMKMYVRILKRTFKTHIKISQTYVQVFKHMFEFFWMYISKNFDFWDVVLLDFGTYVSNNVALKILLQTAHHSSSTAFLHQHHCIEQHSWHWDVAGWIHPERFYFLARDISSLLQFQPPGCAIIFYLFNSKWTLRLG